MGNDRSDRGILRRPEGEPIVGEGERRITRIFPWFVAAVLAIWLCGYLYIDNHSLPKLVETLCLSFTFCFAMLGAGCALFMPRGIKSGYFILGYAILLSCAIWLFDYVTDEFYYADSIGDILEVIGITIEGPTYWAIGFLGTLAVVLFTAIGVTSVISVYLRVYFPNVLLQMKSHASDGTRGKAEKFFLVPDIIDVKDVVVDEPAENPGFDRKGCLSISLYLFILGLLISSYLFVNPYFLDVMDWKMMLAITIMLSMFTPALILPWQIFRGTGARVVSDAPRDFFLWHGAKRRLFTTFMALSAFMMMFLLSVYLGNDVGKILTNYLRFLVPLLATSLMYGVLYCNNFENSDRKTIYNKFYGQK